MSWLLVFIAGLMEIFWPLGLKYSETVLQWGGTIGLLIMSFALLIKAYEKLPVGTVYAVFTGMGTMGIFLIDIFYFDIAVTWQKILFFVAIVVGVIGIKMTTGEEKE